MKKHHHMFFMILNAAFLALNLGFSFMSDAPFVHIMVSFVSLAGIAMAYYNWINPEDE
jgi:hypothetical protein